MRHCQESVQTVIPVFNESLLTRNVVKKQYNGNLEDLSKYQKLSKLITALELPQ